jgi:SulP family sulfate permease
MQRPSFAELFTPKLLTILREGYGAGDFHADAVAGLTVAIVAMPLSMAIAIASGLSPDRGLYTAIVGGFLISALGGSRFQIGGPAGAFIVLVFSIVERHGYDGLVLATIMAGIIMLIVGFHAVGNVHQIHSLSGDGRIYDRDRDHHPRQPAQGVART